MKQLLLPEGTPWYSTRTFWGIVIGVLIFLVLGNYFFTLYNPNASIYDAFINLSLAIGLSVVSVPIIFLKFSVPTFVQIVLYYATMLVLLYMTFRRDQVQTLYPILFVVLFVVGSVVGTAYLSGL